jgi:hypothetical protein
VDRQRRLLPVCCPRSRPACLTRHQNVPICRTNRRTGATGLEPATSGVTGRFDGHDEWRRLTRNRSIHAAFRVSAVRFRMVERSRFQTFAARLLPGTDRQTRAWREVRLAARTLPRIDERSFSGESLAAASEAAPARCGRYGSDRAAMPVVGSGVGDREAGARQKTRCVLGVLAARQRARPAGTELVVLT